MNLQALGYVGVKTTRFDEWDGFATGLVGMQRVDGTDRTRAFRMDDRKQRLIVNKAEDDGVGFVGWEVADAAALDAFAAHLDRARVAVTRGSRALADERHVAELIVFHDPAGNRLEAFYGAAIASDPFKPGRSMSGFRTGPLGMGHVVLNVARIDDAMPFYRDVLGIRLTDYLLQPFKAYFFHVNPRHHSFALIESPKGSVHHLMVETCMLDDVGQAYDMLLRKPEMIGTTLGRHVNDEVTSFYAWSPSKFLFEVGWGGRCIEPEGWKPHERTEGPSLWGHDRSWLPPEGRETARDMRAKLAREGVRMPLNVMEGNFHRAADVCPWWHSAAGGG